MCCHRERADRALPPVAGTIQGPVAIEFRTELPRTIIGKVLRRALRDEADTVPAGMQASRKAM
jgi:acyl-coenzyme A synthetase/AMP-(fatty) acid ligase